MLIFLKNSDNLRKIIILHVTIKDIEGSIAFNIFYGDISLPLAFSWHDQRMILISRRARRSKVAAVTVFLVAPDGVARGHIGVGMGLPEWRDTVGRADQRLACMQYYTAIFHTPQDLLACSTIQYLTILTCMQYYTVFYIICLGNTHS